MSGGYFNYTQFRLSDVIDDLQRVIDNKTYWEDGDIIPDDILEQFKVGLHHIKLAQAYMQRIDWLLSADDGEDCFRRRLEEDLKEI